MVRPDVIGRPMERGPVYEFDNAARLSGLELMDLGSELRIARYGCRSDDGNPIGVVTIIAGEPMGVGDLAGLDPSIVRIYDANDYPVHARFPGRQGDYSLKFFAVTNKIETVVDVIDGEPVGRERKVLHFTPLVPGELHPVMVQGVTVAEYGINDEYRLVIRHVNTTPDAGRNIQVRTIGMQDEYARKMPIENINRFSRKSAQEILDGIRPGVLPSIPTELVDSTNHAVRLGERKDVVVLGQDLQERYRYTTYSVLNLPFAAWGYHQDLVDLLVTRAIEQRDPVAVKDDIGTKIARVLAWIIGFSRRKQQ